MPSSPDDVTRTSFPSPSPAVESVTTPEQTVTFSPDDPNHRATAPINLASVPAGYEMVAELGRGGMGVVYRARQKQPLREVALKMILSGTHAASASVSSSFLGGDDSTCPFQGTSEPDPAVAWSAERSRYRLHEMPAERFGSPICLRRSTRGRPGSVPQRSADGGSSGQHG